MRTAVLLIVAALLSPQVSFAQTPIAQPDATISATEDAAKHKRYLLWKAKVNHDRVLADLSQQLQVDFRAAQQELLAAQKPHQIKYEEDRKAIAKAYQEATADATARREVANALARKIHQDALKPIQQKYEAEIAPFRVPYEAERERINKEHSSLSDQADKAYSAAYIQADADYRQAMTQSSSFDDLAAFEAFERRKASVARAEKERDATMLPFKDLYSKVLRPLEQAYRNKSTGFDSAYLEVTNSITSVFYETSAQINHEFEVEVRPAAAVREEALGKANAEHTLATKALSEQFQTRLNLINKKSESLRKEAQAAYQATLAEIEKSTQGNGDLQ